MQLAFRFYLWNCTLCESFYLPLHFSEVVCRNAFHKGLVRRFGDQWYSAKTLHTLLSPRFASELTDVCKEETTQHGPNMTAHHVVSGLTFGFWEHLATKRFDRYLWAHGIQAMFPYAPKGKGREDLRKLIESVRRWRNRIAHHQAIFDKGPSRKHQETLELIKWACNHTGDWVASSSRVMACIQLRPH
jgi:hypothetical protein